ncbi:MAG: glycosyltransferase family 4 protein [Alphaproteobacteria bacterium]|nr:glycosyltransferase family 4 protein [Alphaproteobacteria bacterium]
MSAAELTLLLGADSLLGRRSGVGRMTWQIAQHAREHPEIGTLRLLAGPSILPPDWLDGLEQDGEAPTSAKSGVRDRVGRVPGAATLRSAWLRRRLNRAARGLPEPVVYHEPNLIARPFDGATVLTINDLSWRVDRGFHPDRRAAWIERRLPGSIAQATRFVAISAFTAGEMTRELGIPRDRIDVVPLAPSALFRPLPQAEAEATLHSHRLRAGGFVLSVSTLEPRKNFDRLLTAHALLPDALRERHPLAIAGGAGWGSALEGEQAERALRAGHLRLLGHVVDEELVALYSQCSAFAFPSLYEGFGLPVIEAMACGAPVVAAATTATGETAGDAALLVDPLDEHSIADALRTLLEDPSSAAPLRRLGLARAATFTWEGAITRLIASWRRALAA